MVTKPQAQFVDTLSGMEKVIDKLDEVIKTAEEENISTTELIGLLFYYAHHLAQEAKDTGLKNEHFVVGEFFKASI